MKKTILTILMIFVMVFSFATSLPVKFLTGGVANAAQNTEISPESLFFVDPWLVREHKNVIYVYDKADGTIKIVDRKTNDFVTDRKNQYKADVSNLLFVDDYMLIYSKEANSFTCVKIEDLSEATFETSSLNSLEESKTMQIVYVKEKPYLLLCPENPTSGKFELASLNATEDGLVINSIKEFNITGDLLASVGSYEISYATATKTDTLLIMLVNGKQIISFNIDPESVSGTQSTITAVSGLDYGEGEQIRNISEITFSSSEKHYAITTNNFIKFYDLNTSSLSSVTFEECGKPQIDLSKELSYDDVCGGDSVIALVSEDEQVLTTYSFDGDSTEPSTLNNPQIDTILYDDPFKFSYMKINQDCLVRPNPYSKEADSVTTAKEGENIAIIGEGRYDRDNSLVNGYVYCILTRDGVNYYGYVNDLYLSDLDQTSYDRQFITVLPYTIVYKYPSSNKDESNTEIRQIQASSSARLEVLSSICDYTTIFNNEESKLETKYLLVKVNGDNSQIGFVERSRVIGKVETKDRVIPDATVLRNNSQIFAEKDDKSEQIMVLDKGARVKVIGKRDTVTNLTHVRFNDAHGNEVEGYIYTYNLEADSWNMVQMIGILLIVINVILLIIIICVKNKVTK